MIQGTNNNNQLVSFNDDDDSDLNDSYDEDGFSCEQSATKDPVHVGKKQFSAKNYFLKDLKNKTFATEGKQIFLA